jgi:hypothetical protein
MENENNRHYPFGRKEAEGFAQRSLHDLNSVGCPEMPPGLLGPTPIGAGRSSPYMSEPAAAGEQPRR